MLIALILAATLDASVCASSNPVNCPHSSTTGAVNASVTYTTDAPFSGQHLVLILVSAQGVGVTNISVASSNPNSFAAGPTRIKQCLNGTTADAEVWYAFTKYPPSGPTVTATVTAATQRSASMVLAEYSIADANNGASGTAPTNWVCTTGSGTAGAVTITPATNKSHLWGAGSDSGTATARTVTAGASSIAEVHSTGTTWTEVNIAPGSASQSFGTSAPTTSTVWAFVGVDVADHDTATAFLPAPPLLRQGVCAVNGDCASLGAGSICDLSALLCTVPTDYHGFHPGSFFVAAAAVGLTNLAKVPWALCDPLNVTPGGTSKTCSVPVTASTTSRFGKGIR